MDKIVGKLVADLERLKLRNNTLIIFVGDNGTAGAAAARSSIGGGRLSGAKGSMLEAGALVPLIANWPGKTPAGKVTPHLIDSTDFHPTFAELAGDYLPANTVVDGHSFAPQLRGTSQQPTREWIYIQLARQWYVRDAKWKLDQAGALYDRSKAPFEEPLVARDSKAPAAVAARQRLQAVLTKINPAAGILDEGDGTGRHASREEKRKKRQR